MTKTKAEQLLELRSNGLIIIERIAIVTDDNPIKPERLKEIEDKLKEIPEVKSVAFYKTE